MLRWTGGKNCLPAGNSRREMNLSHDALFYCSCLLSSTESLCALCNFCLQRPDFTQLSQSPSPAAIGASSTVSDRISLLVRFLHLPPPCPLQSILPTSSHCSPVHPLRTPASLTDTARAMPIWLNACRSVARLVFASRLSYFITDACRESRLRPAFEYVAAQSTPRMMYEHTFLRASLYFLQGGLAGLAAGSL